MGLHARPLQEAQVKSVGKLRFPHATWCGQKRKKIPVISPLGSSPGSAPPPAGRLPPPRRPPLSPSLSPLSPSPVVSTKLSPQRLSASACLCLSDSVPLRLRVSSSLPLPCPQRQGCPIPLRGCHPPSPPRPHPSKASLILVHPDCKGTHSSHIPAPPWPPVLRICPVFLWV